MADRILWLHFGIQKTGSSSFQFLLHKYQEKLRDAGVVYLDPYFSLSPNPWCPAEVTSRAFFEQKKFSQFWLKNDRLLNFRDFVLGSIPASSRHLILSNENFYPIVNPQGRLRFDLDALRKFADDLSAEIRIVIFLRRQDEHLISYYQERVKASFRINNASRDFLALPADLDAYARVVTRTNYYDYAGQIARLQERFPVQIQLMEDAIRGPGLMASHCELFQLPLACAQLDVSKNVGLEAHATVALRRFLADSHQKGLKQQQMLRAKNHLFRHHTGGPKLDLELETKTEIMDFHRQANEALLQDFCGLNTNSELLAPPHMPSVTTAEINGSRVDALVDELVRLTT